MKIKNKNKSERMPNLATILMIENVLSKQKEVISIPRLKEKLPRKIMHPTLKIALDYLWKSKKIEYTPKGIIWVFEERDIKK